MAGSADPIAAIEWLDARTLNANDYNPNVVMNMELRLLERSILKTGWVQPILTQRTERMIIDGFHRRMLAMTSEPLIARYAYRVPCAVLNVSRADAMILTIRMNRAKGSHVAVRMATVIKELVDVHGVTPEELAAEIGGTVGEVALLYQNDLFKARNLKDYRYGKAWVPDLKTGSIEPPAAPELTPDAE